MAEALAIAISDTYAATERTIAARLYLTFTVPKPPAKRPISFSGDGMEWLRQAAAQNGAGN